MSKTIRLSLCLSFFIFFPLSICSKYVAGIPVSIPMSAALTSESYGNRSVSPQLEEKVCYVLNDMSGEKREDVEIRQLDPSVGVFGALSTHSYLYVSEKDLSTLPPDEQLFLIAKAVAHFLNHDYEKMYAIQSAAKIGNIGLLIELMSVLPALRVSLGFLSPVCNTFIGLFKLNLVQNYVCSPLVNKLYVPFVTHFLKQKELNADKNVLAVYPFLIGPALKMLNRLESDPAIDPFSKEIIRSRKKSLEEIRDGYEREGSLEKIEAPLKSFVGTFEDLSQKENMHLAKGMGA